MIVVPNGKMDGCVKQSRGLGVVVHACNPSTLEAEAGGLRVQG
jgi:hypothetical protein